MILRLSNFRRKADRSTADENTAQSTALAGHANDDPGETTRASSPPRHNKGRAPAGFFIEGVARVLGPPPGPPPHPTPRLSPLRHAKLGAAHWPAAATSPPVQNLLAHNVPRGDGITGEDLLRRSREAERDGNPALARALERRVEERFSQRPRLGL